MCLFCLEEHNPAEKIYKDLLESSSSKGLIQYLRGVNLEYLRKAELAINCYNLATKEKEYPNEIFLRLGNVYYRLKEFGEAIRSLNIYIKNNDSTKVAYRIRAHSYAQIAKFDSAIIDYKNFLKLDSSELDIYFDRAFCYKEMENYADAISDYQHVIKFREKDRESLGLLAECKYLSGDTIGAYNILNTTMRKCRFLEERGFYLLGTINLHYKNYDSAIVNFDRNIRYNGQHIEALTSRGLAYYYKAEYEKAKDDLTSALKIDATDIVALYVRGLVNIKLNKPDEAYKDLNLAASLGHPQAKRAILIYLKDFVPKN
jgi:tetratricopeptide (TPR) repeat protein